MDFVKLCRDFADGEEEVHTVVKNKVAEYDVHLEMLRPEKMRSLYAESDSVAGGNAAYQVQKQRLHRGWGRAGIGIQGAPHRVEHQYPEVGEQLEKQVYTVQKIIARRGGLYRALLPVVIILHF